MGTVTVYQTDIHFDIDVSTTEVHQTVIYFLSCKQDATHRGIFSKSYQIKPKSDCIHHFQIDLEPNGCPFGSKSIGKR